MAAYRLALIFEESMYLDYFPEFECQQVVPGVDTDQEEIMVEELSSNDTQAIDNIGYNQGKETLDSLVDSFPVINPSEDALEPLELVAEQHGSNISSNVVHQVIVVVLVDTVGVFVFALHSVGVMTDLHKDGLLKSIAATFIGAGHSRFQWEPGSLASQWQLGSYWLCSKGSYFSSTSGDLEAIRVMLNKTIVIDRQKWRRSILIINLEDVFCWWIDRCLESLHTRTRLALDCLLSKVGGSLGFLLVNIVLHNSVLLSQISSFGCLLSVLVIHQVTLQVMVTIKRSVELSNNAADPDLEFSIRRHFTIFGSPHHEGNMEVVRILRFDPSILYTHVITSHYHFGNLLQFLTNIFPLTSIVGDSQFASEELCQIAWRTLATSFSINYGFKALVNGRTEIVIVPFFQEYTNLTAVRHLSHFLILPDPESLATGDKIQGWSPPLRVSHILFTLPPYALKHASNPYLVAHSTELQCHPRSYQIREQIHFYLLYGTSRHSVSGAIILLQIGGFESFGFFRSANLCAKGKNMVITRFLSWLVHIPDEEGKHGLLEVYGKWEATKTWPWLLTTLAAMREYTEEQLKENGRTSYIYNCATTGWLLYGPFWRLLQVNTLLHFLPIGNWIATVMAAAWHLYHSGQPLLVQLYTSLDCTQFKQIIVYHFNCRHIALKGRVWGGLHLVIDTTSPQCYAPYAALIQKATHSLWATCLLHVFGDFLKDAAVLVNIIKNGNLVAACDSVDLVNKCCIPVCQSALVEAAVYISLRATVRDSSIAKRLGTIHGKCYVLGFVSSPHCNVDVPTLASIPICCLEIFFITNHVISLMNWYPSFIKKLFRMSCSSHFGGKRAIICILCFDPGIIHSYVTGGSLWVHMLRWQNGIMVVEQLELFTLFMTFGCLCSSGSLVPAHDIDVLIYSVDRVSSIASWSFTSVSILSVVSPPATSDRVSHRTNVEETFVGFCSLPVIRLYWKSFLRWPLPVTTCPDVLEVSNNFSLPNKLLTLRYKFGFGPGILWSLHGEIYFYFGQSLLLHDSLLLITTCPFVVFLWLIAWPTVTDGSKDR